MKLSILHVLSPFVTACPDAIGDSEVSFACLDRWLVQNGHRSITVASQDSQVNGIHVRTAVAPGPVSRAEREDALRRHRRNIERTLERERIDVIHLHGSDYPDYLPVTGVPTVATVAQPRTGSTPSPRRLALLAAQPHASGTLKMKSARQIIPWRLPSAVPYGGPSVAQPSQERAMALCLAPISPESSCHLVLKAGKRAGVPVRLAGRVTPQRRSLRYHLKQILPRLDCERRFVGAADPALRRTLIESALCLVLPPCGGSMNLLIAEAMSVGTPVISFDPAAGNGMIEPGVTGYFVHNENELVKALQKASHLSPAACLRRAAGLISRERMVHECVKLYRDMAQPHALPLAS